jgi:hypothetical protein
MVLLDPLALGSVVGTDGACMAGRDGGGDGRETKGEVVEGPTQRMTSTGPKEQSQGGIPWLGGLAIVFRGLVEPWSCLARTVQSFKDLRYL